MICDAHDTRRSLADVARRLGSRHRSCRTRRLATTKDDSAERFPRRLLNLARRPSTRTVPFISTLRARSVEAGRRKSPVYAPSLCALLPAFRHSLPLLTIYSSCHVYYGSSVLTVNIRTQLSSTARRIRARRTRARYEAYLQRESLKDVLKDVEKTSSIIFWTSLESFESLPYLEYNIM